MERFLPLSSPSSMPGSIAAISPSEEEEVLRPGTSNQGNSRPALDNVPMDNLPLIFLHIKSYYGPSKINGKMKCKFCNKEISYSSTSYYNLKCHYERQHSVEYPNLVAALRAGSKRGRHSSRGSDLSSPLKKGQSSIESTFKEKFNQLYYKKVDQLTRAELTKEGTSLCDNKIKPTRKLEKSGSKARIELEHDEEMNLLLDTTSGTSKSPLSSTFNSLLVPPESPLQIGSQQSMHSSGHSQNLLKVVTNLFSNSKYSDTSIVCEGQLFPAHKVVLAASSGYFDEIFSLLPDKSSVIVLKDISSDIFNDLLKFIYLGEVQIEQSKVMDFINAASSLKVMGIPRINLCSNNTDIVADEAEECGSERNIPSDGLLASALASKACAPFVFVAKHVPLERKECGRKRKVPSSCTTLESAPSKKIYTSSDNVDTATAKHTSSTYEPQVLENKPKCEFFKITPDENEARQKTTAAVARLDDGLSSVIKNNEDNGCLATVVEECWIKEEFECESHPVETQEEYSCSSIETS